MKTATKIFLILSIPYAILSILGSIVYMVIFGSFLVNFPLICYIITRIIGLVVVGAALSDLNRARACKGLRSLGIWVMIFSTIIGGAFMLALEDRHLNQFDNKKDDIEYNRDNIQDLEVEYTNKKKRKSKQETYIEYTDDKK